MELKFSANSMKLYTFNNTKYHFCNQSDKEEVYANNVKVHNLKGKKTNSL